MAVLSQQVQLPRRLARFCAIVAAVCMAFPSGAQDGGALMGGGIVGVIVPQSANGSSLKRATRLSPKAPMDCVGQFREGCLDRQAIIKFQSDLARVGLSPGATDGFIGRQTRNALDRFRAIIDSPVEGGLRPFEVDLLARIVSQLQGSVVPTPSELRVLATQAGLPQMVAASATNVASNPEPFAAIGAGGPPMPTRAFAGPGQFPPDGFRGYGLIVFPATAAVYDQDRHMMICQAFLNTMQPTASARRQLYDQFVTVWPLADALLASRLNGKTRRDEAATICTEAIEAYDLSHAQEVLSGLRGQGINFEGVGPFLLGWLPANTYGQPGTLILQLDLSRVNSYEQSLTMMQSWLQKIESDPALLRDGFSVENTRRLLRDWSDLHGPNFLRLISGGD